ncbi:MAG: ankyrin repeat domain-containing protein [Rickettsiales endosymbiont of Dermacentor nuttalli]
MKQEETEDSYRIRAVFGGVKDSTTKEKIAELDELLAVDSRNVRALNSIFPDKKINVLHNLAIKEHCAQILPMLNKYIGSFLYKQRDFEGDTPIMSAIGSNRLSNAKALVEAYKNNLRVKGFGEDIISYNVAILVNTKNNEGQTPLHEAADYHNAEAIKYLISLGADTNKIDNYGHRPLYYAAAGIAPDDDKIATIVNLGTNSMELRVPDQDGITPFAVLRRRHLWGDLQDRMLIEACDRKQSPSQGWVARTSNNRNQFTSYQAQELYRKDKNNQSSCIIL